jgi:hypothetical protein
MALFSRQRRDSSARTAPRPLFNAHSRIAHCRDHSRPRANHWLLSRICLGAPTPHDVLHHESPILPPGDRRMSVVQAVKRIRLLVMILEQANSPEINKSVGPSNAHAGLAEIDNHGTCRFLA